MYSILDLSRTGGMMSNLRLAFDNNGLRFLHNPYGAIMIRSIENTIGNTSLIERANGDERLSPDTQIPPYSQSKKHNSGRLSVASFGSGLSRAENKREVSSAGSKSQLGGRRSRWKNQTDALWKTYPRELLRTLRFGIPPTRG